MNVMIFSETEKEYVKEVYVTQDLCNIARPSQQQLSSYKTKSSKEFDSIIAKHGGLLLS